MIQGILWNWHKRRNTLTWQMFIADPGAFNEDVGETAFGVLARALTGTPNLKKLDQCNIMWQRTQLNMQVAAALSKDLKRSSTTSRSYTVIKPDCKDLQHTAVFLTRLITACGFNKHNVYNCKVLDMGFEKDAVKHLAKPVTVLRFAKVDIRKVAAKYAQVRSTASLRFH